MDCEASPEMLETIFFPNNAIHDGGVIINEDRILSAACIFPLTRRQDISKTIGTRHRAAIGMSEESDSLVIVVSGGDWIHLDRLQGATGSRHLTNQAARDAHIGVRDPHP